MPASVTFVEVFLLITFLPLLEFSTSVILRLSFQQLLDDFIDTAEFLLDSDCLQFSEEVVSASMELSLESSLVPSMLRDLNL
jgi:hypothetical protein